MRDRTKVGKVREAHERGIVKTWFIGHLRVIFIHFMNEESTCQKYIFSMSVKSIQAISKYAGQLKVHSNIRE